MRKIIKPAVLFSVMGGAYCMIELLWRGYTHWSMFLLAGVCGLVIGGLNEYVAWEIPFWIQDFIGTAIALLLEFVFGCVLNLWLKLNIWDYSNLPLNLLGQICLPFALVWAVLTAVAIVLDDYLRYWLFGEEKPVYYWRFK